MESPQLLNREKHENDIDYIKSNHFDIYEKALKLIL